MQNKCMPASPLHCPGALLLGDAFNMRHPLTGTGVHTTVLLLSTCSSQTATAMHACMHACATP